MSDWLGVFPWSRWHSGVLQNQISRTASRSHVCEGSFLVLTSRAAVVLRADGLWEESFDLAWIVPSLVNMPVSRLIPFKIGQPKKQIVPKTVERDFEREYGKLQQLEDQTKKLQKDMKKSTDADLAMSKSAVKISSDLLSNPLCEQDPVFLEMVTAFDTAMKRMDSFNQEKVNQIQKTVIEPLKKFSSVFPSLNVAVKRREQTLQDYKRLQSKVEKYEEKEKTGPVLAKLHQAREELRPVKEDFEAKNKQLLEEMPKFYSSRIDYFKPSFESLVRAQVRSRPLCLPGTGKCPSGGVSPCPPRCGASQALPGFALLLERGTVSS
nr:PREDICTED: bridging integrator 3 [Apteryx mantelli mantelli]